MASGQLQTEYERIAAELDLIARQFDGFAQDADADVPDILGFRFAPLTLTSSYQSIYGSLQTKYRANLAAAARILIEAHCKQLLTGAAALMVSIYNGSGWPPGKEHSFPALFAEYAAVPVESHTSNPKITAFASALAVIPPPDPLHCQRCAQACRELVNHVTSLLSANQPGALKNAGAASAPPAATPCLAAQMKSRRERLPKQQREQRARDYLGEHPHATARQLAEGIGCSVGTVSSLGVWKATVETRRQESSPKRAHIVSLTGKVQCTYGRQDETLEALIKDQDVDDQQNRIRPGGNLPGHASYRGGKRDRC